jgi:hypothetical protein
MAKFSLTAALVLILSFHSVAQKLTHPLRVVGAPSSLRTASAKRLSDTLKVLAIMVQFQTDPDTRTSGNGRFDSTTAQQFIIDAPPRDSAYFADHLKFAKNYFQKASKGKQNVSATVLGTVLTLPKQMKEYAPVKSNLPLGQMVEEAWTMADSAYASFPFQSYDLFIVFHAGSGKDIDLRGSIGYDPTPYDLPSLYFSLDGLKSVFGPSYHGVELKNHPGFAITNSIILPETENRVLPAVGGDFLYQLGINGLVVANIASHLGLPDLFNTKTGGTAIGRFGLMDGQAIFSFFGLFPPEPSAWEKIYLGWTSPITAVPAGALLRAPAVGLYQTGNDTIYRIPLSAKEYFLVENRNRDARQDGEKLTLRWNGQESQRSYLQDDPHFNAFNVDSIYGTVVDVDELDWSLPGAIDYSGGILIWHIDETIIEKNLATNTINADPNHRGIDLEEADGSQDLGQSYGLLDPGSGSEDGSPIDYWFAKNTSPVYKNEFSETTNPNSLSNSLARSHITLSQFSDAGPVMTFRANVGDGTISLLKTVKRSRVAQGNYDAPLVSDVDNDGKIEFLLYDGLSIDILRENLSPYTNKPSGFFSTSLFPPVVVENFSGNNSKMIATAAGSGFSLLFIDTAATGSGIIAAVDTTVTTPVQSTNSKVFVGSASGRLLKYIAPGVGTSYHPFSTSVKLIALLPDENWVASNGDSLKNSFGNRIGFSGKEVQEIINARIESNGSVSTIVKLDDNSFEIYDASTLEFKNRFTTGYIGATITSIADLDRDGTLDIIVGQGGALYAYNYRGTALDNFPFKVSDGGSILGSPAIVGITNSSSKAIIFGTSNGHLYAIDSEGKILNGFPLQTGGILSSPAISAGYLVVASTDSSVYFYKTGSLFDTSRIYWSGYLSDKYHSNFVENKGAVLTKSTELLPSSFAYNWPNPVYDRTTNIRYYLSKPAAVRIRIYNMAGELIDDFSGPGLANLDNEIQWDVSKVQSGVYFAQIKASTIGEEKSVIVKIAVVK